MKKTNINYPYPVLSVANDDYLDSSFNIIYNESSSIDRDNTELNLSYELKCDGLAELISENIARVAIYLESAVCGYRNIVYFENGKTNLSVNISLDEVSQKILIKGYIIAVKEMNRFTLKEHNQDLFANIPFRISPGDILALAEHQYTVPLNAYDPLANRNSIFAIRKNTTTNQPINIDLDEDRISIFLNEEMFGKYQEINASSDAKGILSSLFVMPSLVEIFSKIQTGSDQYENLIWYVVLNEKLAKHNIDLSQGLVAAANQLLGYVLNTNMDSLIAICHNNEGNDE